MKRGHTEQPHIEIEWLAVVDTEFELVIAAVGVVDNLRLRSNYGSPIDAAMDMLVRRSDMYKEAAAERPEPHSGKKNKENQDQTVPQRCENCGDLANCDTDFCLHWWH